MDSLLVDSPGDLPSKHFPITPDPVIKSPSQITRNHFVRATAKRQSQYKGSNICRDTGFQCTSSYRGPTTCRRCGQQDTPRRPELEKILHFEISCASLSRFHPRWCNIRRTPNSRSKGNGTSDELEGRDLAQSQTPLPSDRYRLVRRPTLEREEAFRDASTARGNVYIGRKMPLSEDDEVAELYRMGLLYDDEQERGEGFNLDSIKHEEPVYSIKPSKTSRKKRSQSFSFNSPLHLDLSFTDLGGDQTIAQLLSSSSSDDSLPPTRTVAPLRVIYELDGSQPSFDVDTSQPPDLISDEILTDYDCFSDSELDDLPSQREVFDSAATPTSDAWVVLGDDS
ncbi:hypothetical protein NW752_010811 [Fusarium irregulare]|uniref:Uncharacterized protein n=1 Tax=Fusarium irregulare TaxID=2494466 RepID=A0A9W8PG86_9HYPO|nr:hypothetical protein LB507_007631 [Fusarium sp. FIESC RH6]KAJ4004111.1 hypothetical protein NW766_011968 [Fusarium irregulare]KAJ4006164.1 hypothetical protein NW752_010811 [Fusarium irregulare]